MKVLKARNEGEDQNFSIKQLNSFKERRLNQKSLTLVSKLSPERVMKSFLKCLKLEAPEMVKILCLVCQVTPSSSQICREVQNLAVEGGRDDQLFWMNAQNIFFPGA